MFVFVKYNDNFEKIKYELKKLNYIPVFLFEIVLDNKLKIKENLENIERIIEKKKIKYSGIIVKINKLNNNLVGTINNLKLKFNLVIGFGGLNKLNRFFLENTNIDFLLNPQNSFYKNKIDFIHHFNSGLNQVLFKFAKEKNIGLIFSLNFINNYSNKYLITKEIGRINQNLKLCNNFKVNFYLNFIIEDIFQIKNIVEISSILSLFNVSTNQKIINLNIIENTIKLNLEKKSDKYVNEYIKFN